MKFYLISLGCSKNTADSEYIANSFLAAGWVWASQARFADLLLINTCGFIKDAKEESLSVIMRALELKNRYKRLRVCVFGCLIKRYKTEIEKEISEIDFLYEFLSDGDIKQLIRLNSEAEEPSEVCLERRFLTPPHIGILKIAEGCCNMCSYCAIPGIRGPFCSRDERVILKEAQELVASGAKEISVVAQDITSYGIDTKGKPALPALLKELSKLDVAWLRLHYMHPRGLTNNFIDELFAADKVVPYFDIPFQHVSDRILNDMNRHTSLKHMVSLIEHIRKNYPEAVIRTTFIVGFPGETKKDFDKLIDFIEEYPFDRLGAFAYSREEGTKAASLNKQVSQTVRQSRLDRLMSLQQIIAKEQNQRLVGKTIEVMADEVKPKMVAARTKYDAYEVDNGVVINGSHSVKPGEIIKVKVLSADAYDFKAKIV